MLGSAGPAGLEAVTVTETETWVSIDAPAGGTTPMSVGFTAAAAALTPGAYETDLSVNLTSPTESVLLPVTLTVPPSHHYHDDDAAGRVRAVGLG